jgi:hypothetical protein
MTKAKLIERINELELFVKDQNNRLSVRRDEAQHLKDDVSLLRSQNNKLYADNARLE